MGYPTPIEWTDATWNPIGGCDIHSPGCINCYAQRIAGSARLASHPLYSGVTKVVKGKPVFNGMLTALPPDHPAWIWPLRWKGAKHSKLGPDPDGRSAIFVGDMSDLFHKGRPKEIIDRVVGTILLSFHVGQLLSKRSDVMAAYFLDKDLPDRLDALMNVLAPAHWCRREIDDSGGWPNSRLWCGFSAERPQEMHERANHMRRLAEAGWQIFVSIEPLLERVILPSWFANMPKKPWVIVGGESGPDAREMYPAWVRDIRDHAAEMGCPFFFKQWGEFGHEYQEDANGQVLIFPSDAENYQRIGKKRAGRLLDGIEHNAFPTP